MAEDADMAGIADLDQEAGAGVPYPGGQRRKLGFRGGQHRGGGLGRAKRLRQFGQERRHLGQRRLARHIERAAEDRGDALKLRFGKGIIAGRQDQPGRRKAEGFKVRRAAQAEVGGVPGRLHGCYPAEGDQFGHGLRRMAKGHGGFGHGPVDCGDPGQGRPGNGPRPTPRHGPGHGGKKGAPRHHL